MSRTTGVRPSPAGLPARPGPRRLGGLGRIGRLGIISSVSVLVAGCSLGGGGDGGFGNGPGGSSGTPERTSASPSVDPSVVVPPSGELTAFYAQELEWVGCELIDPPEGVTGQNHECTTMQVPLDYAAPGEGTILLSLTRLPATGDRIGSLVLNPGGPGGSGVDYALQAGVVTSEELRAAYDVVGFDPRGVARSAGVDCLDDAAYDDFSAADPSPDEPRELADLVELADGLAAGCADDRAAPFMDTVSATRDMDVLRAVLGDADLTFLGKSYGTVLGAMYAELFPDRVGRFVLDGAVDLTRRPATDTTAALEQARGFEVALESFVADCSVQPDCPLSGTVDDGVAQVRGLVASLEDAPLPTGDDARPLTQGLGLFALIGPLYQYDAWPVLRAGLEGGLAGDGEVLLYVHDLFAERSDDGTYRGNGGEAIYAVNCIDGGADPEGLQALTVADFDAFAAVLAVEAPTFGPQLAYGGLPCLDWPFAPVAWPEIDGEGAPPIVVIGTERDPATPLVWAERLAEQLTSGVLITYDGDGHTAYGQTGSGCVDDAVDAYFLEGTVPEDGLACTADY